MSRLREPGARRRCPPPSRGPLVSAREAPGALAAAGSTGFSDRDRLLLAFADLASYGVAARPASARPAAAVAAEMRALRPGALGSAVTWSRDDEGRFDADGWLRGPLALDCSDLETALAVRAACAHAGVELRPGTLTVAPSA